jgi:WD40-like Beta Propeller Repeat
MRGISRGLLFPLCALILGGALWSGQVGQASVPASNGRIAALWSGQVGQASVPGSNGRIAFDRGGRIFTMRPDGTRLHKIVGNRGGQATDPVWGPGGKRILFERETRSGVDRIWIVGAAGRNAVRLTDGSNPSWAPGGHRFVYECEQTNPKGQPYRDLCIYRLATGLSRPLMMGRFRASVKDSAWAPDGGRIAFARGVVVDLSNTFEPTYNIFTVRPDGGGLRRLTGTPRVIETSPKWAPGGRRLVFARYGAWCVDCSEFPELLGLATIKRSGADKRELPDSMEEEPAWSPDGTMIVASRPEIHLVLGNPPRPGIWLLTPKGKHIRRIGGPITSVGYFDGGGLDWLARP